ncbi:hypothetical protein P154DRAFT_201820 [Amniculicola lignicola CBS 123094]|uniref:Uncharacterized protein n=1 Tax=Amniculicola lignicola CBS 123094 TaxID=1392246 RepID=A0A6A5WJS2_9PLEO|nr:hypothetical protein P154DRAFT_201820 [Amniculicola lignicola CBS 123094]
MMGRGTTSVSIVPILPIADALWLTLPYRASVDQRVGLCGRDCGSQSPSGSTPNVIPPPIPHIRNDLSMSYLLSLCTASLHGSLRDASPVWQSNMAASTVCSRCLLSNSAAAAWPPGILHVGGRANGQSFVSKASSVISGYGILRTRASGSWAANQSSPSYSTPQDGFPEAECRVDTSGQVGHNNTPTNDGGSELRTRCARRQGS